MDQQNETTTEVGINIAKAPGAKIVLSVENMTRSKSASGGITFHCGDAVAQALAGLSLEHVKTLASQALDIDCSKYEHLNPGQQRMTLGNLIRNMTRRDESLIAPFNEVLVSVQELAEKEAKEKAEANREADEAKAKAKEEAERLKAEKAEARRLAKEAKEKEATEKAEARRLAKEAKEAEKAEKAKARLEAKEKRDREREAKAQAKREEAEKAEKAKARLEAKEKRDREREAKAQAKREEAARKAQAKADAAAAKLTGGDADKQQDLEGVDTAESAE